jgi:ubiquinone/menaquinone biosynthesis C-methylase UbiE
MSERIQPHNARPATVWSAGGNQYDEISRGIADAIEHCVLRLNPQPGERILDLSTGTGWASRLAARRGAAVVGVDIAEQLLEAARARAEAERLPIAYELGDAENLPFADGEFDAVVSTFGVMFASRPEAAAAELARVCRRDGRIALTTWAKRRECLSDVQSHAALYARAAESRATVAVRVGTQRTDQRTARRVVSAAVREGHFVLSRAQRRRRLANLCDRLRSRPACWRTASTLIGWRLCAPTSWRFTTGFATALGICVPREYWLAIGRRV